MSEVLIVTNEQDLAADLVVLELERRQVEVLRCNTERLPEWRFTLEPGRRWKLEDPLGRTADSATTSSVWWRRPEAPRPPTPVGHSQQQAFAAQWQAALDALASVPGPRWMSTPAAVRAAEDKASQLAMAERLGFRVPETRWTNQVAAASAVGDDAGVVVKPVTAAAWEDDYGPAFVFAGRVPASELPAEGALVTVPGSFQRPVWPKRDVRVTVIGERALSAILEPHDDGDLDWRLHPDRPWSPYSLEFRATEKCVRLVRELGLRFGGIDLAIDGRGDAWFLEINPNGEWGWLAQAAGLPIVEALADDLTLCDASRT